MSLNIYLQKTHKCPHCAHDIDDEPRAVYSANITRNLNVMWEAAGVYGALYESDGKAAADILSVLEQGLEDMRADPARFEKFNASNGWGTYGDAVPFLADLVLACRKNPSAVVRVSE